MKATPIKLLSDFRRYGLIGKWFGELRLLRVSRDPANPRSLNEALCGVVCSQLHESIRPWRQLRNRRYKPVCLDCHPECQAKRASVSSMTAAQLLKAIAELAIERRRLFDALLADRRRVPGQDSVGYHNRDLITSAGEMVKDAYNYALVVTDPAKDLAELLGEPGRAGAGASSSLADGMFTYFEGVD